jgi:hypothetical protein
MDHVIEDLDEVWPMGAGRLHIGGKACFVGLSRMFRKGGEAVPHDDRADIDFPCPETRDIRDQAFVNVYVSKTSGGGKIQIWNRVITDRDEYDRMRINPGHYGLRRDLLGVPEIELDPPLGSLVIASARQIHAVTACEGDGERLSNAGFIDFFGELQRLGLHS